MIRDKNRDIYYFNNYIIQASNRIEKFELLIATGNTPEDRIPIVMHNIGSIKLRLLVAKYSAGFPLSDIETDYIDLLNNYSDYWLEGHVLMKHNGRELKQYLDYDDMLWMLSLGILLNVPNENYRILSELINRDGVKDKIYEYFIRFKLNDKHFFSQESYEFGWELYSSLRTVMDNEVKNEFSVNLLDRALNIDWNNDHKEMLKSLNSKHDTYFGAWSFETAAMVIILDLEDSLFRKSPYYPSDLIDYYRNIRINTSRDSF